MLRKEMNNIRNCVCGKMLISYNKKRITLILCIILYFEKISATILKYEELALDTSY